MIVLKTTPGVIRSRCANELYCPGNLVSVNKGLKEKLEAWKGALESKQLQVNVKKAKWWSILRKLLRLGKKRYFLLQFPEKTYDVIISCCGKLKKYSFVTEFPYIFPHQVNLSKKEIWATLQSIYASEYNKKTGTDWLRETACKVDTLSIGHEEEIAWHLLWKNMTCLTNPIKIWDNETLQMAHQSCSQPLCTWERNYRRGFKDTIISYFKIVCVAFCISNTVIPSFVSFASVGQWIRYVVVSEVNWSRNLSLNSNI